MVKQIKMPSAGQTTDAAVITKWLVSPGDTVKRGDILLEAETDKAVLPVESFAAGIVLECSVQEGDTVDAGDQLALVGDEKDWSSHDTAAKPVSPVPVQTTSAPQEPADDFIPILAQDRSAELSQAAVPVAEHAAAYPDAMPNAKRLAKECGIELSAVKAANGSFIKKCDVEQHLIQTASVEQPDETTKYAVTPMTKMRAAIGRRMLESTSSIPSYAVTVRVNMTGAMLLKEKAAAAFDLKLSYNDILMKAVASAAHSFPLLNARYENDEIRIYPHTDIGLAVGLEGALVVPVVRAAELKSLAEIARSNRENIDKARTGSLTADTIQGASLTISNLGMYGVDHFTAIINPPESCIFAVGDIEMQPVWEKDHWEPCPMMSITVSFDHRMIDGAYGARMLARVKELLQAPQLMLC